MNFIYPLLYSGMSRPRRGIKIVRLGKERVSEGDLPGRGRTTKEIVHLIHEFSLSKVNVT